MEDEYGESGGARPWDDFLPEAVRPLDTAELSRFADKRILITGAGGYLGSALAHALSPLTRQPLVLLDHAEYGLYRLEQELRDSARPHVVVGSMLDRSLLKELFQQHAPHLVLHAAALKHVPLMEENPLAAAETNVLGTDLVTEVALQAGVERFLLLSTDKAVDPINVMGATKRIAEQIVLSRGRQGTGVFAVARLCNVLGSTGSVAPSFVRQIAKGGPVTLTHAETTRFFLSRTDAVRFLLRATLAAAPSSVVAPALERSYRVRDLAEHLMHRVGKGEEAIQVMETGLRMGDKLHELLISSTENASAGPNGDFLQVLAPVHREPLAELLQSIRSALQMRDPSLLMQALRHAVPSYTVQIMSSQEREHV